MFIEKYIFPACLVAWTSLGYAISQLRLKEVYAMGIAALIGMAGIPTYKNVYFADRDGQKALERTLAYTGEVFTEDTLLLTDNSHESWTILEYYYPKATSQYIWPEADFEMIDYKSQNYLLLKAPIDAYYTEVFTNAGFAIREFMSDGHIGTHRLYIYELVAE